MSRTKYYKQKEKHEFSEDHAAKRRKLFFDKRVKSILNCDLCDGPLTLAESRRNGGICDECTNTSQL